MCFSPEASFAVGGALVPTGVYCIRTALRKNPRLLPIAVIPLVFAAQQIAEGFVWLGLNHGDAAQTRAAALVFLFFALAFWPFWFACVNAILETRPVRKRFFIVCAVVTTGWFWVLHYPLIVGPESLLTVEVMHHSIRYSYSNLAVYQVIPRPLLLALYVLSIGVPMSLGPKIVDRSPLALLVASVVVAVVLYDYAFVSVWCFFAAVLNGYGCVLFHRLPEPAPAARHQIDVD